MSKEDMMSVNAELLANRAYEKRCAIVMRSQLDKNEVREKILIGAGKSAALGTACVAIYKIAESSGRKNLAISSLSILASRQLIKLLKVYKNEHLPLQNRHL